MEEILGLKQVYLHPVSSQLIFFFLSCVVLPTAEEIYIAFIFWEIIIPLLWINKELGICLISLFYGPLASTSLFLFWANDLVHFFLCNY